MKITVSKNELYNKLKSIGRIIQAKNVSPVYDYFLFEIDSESNVYVTAGEDGARMKVRIDYLKSVQERKDMTSSIDTSVKLTGEDPILTLSTCNGNDEQRYLVQAVLLSIEQ